MTDREPTLLFSEDAIGKRVGELADRISHDYAGAGELWLVGVLKGAFIFLADLSRRLSISRRVDFVALGSYSDSSSGGAIRLIMDLRTSVEGKHVLLVDDIMDTGSTLGYLLEMVQAHRPASVKTCVLTRKSKPRRTQLAVDYVGFEIPDVWVVGYGLDFDDRHRTLPYIGILELPESPESDADRGSPLEGRE